MQGLIDRLMRTGPRLASGLIAAAVTLGGLALGGTPAHAVWAAAGRT